MSADPITALVILNYNGRSYLERFLPSVIQHSPHGTHFVVGDNASTDDSIDFIKTNYAQIQVVQLEKNYGFAEGYNQVLRQVHASFYFLLNSDVELRSTWAPLLNAMQQDTLLAACQPKILSYHQPEYFEHAGAAGGWMDILGYPLCMGRILDHFEKDGGQYDLAREIFWASGAAMMVRASIFHDLGGFDGAYFAHMEEIDWCWRAKRCGYSIKSIPQTAVYHIGGGTLPYHSNRKIFLNFRNNLATILKNESALKLVYLIPLRFVLDGLAAMVFLLKGNIKGFLAVMHAYLSVLSWIPDIITKRKSTNRLAALKTFNQSGVFKGSLLFHYFILGHKRFNQLVITHA